MGAAYAGANPVKAAETVTAVIPMPKPATTYQTPNVWAQELTAGFETTMDYHRQQLSMRTVLIDGESTNEICKQVESRGHKGVAIPSERLVCIHPNVWKQNSLQTQYVLAHELAHIALGDFGKALGDHAHAHRNEHFNLTIHIMGKLMERSKVPAPIRFITKQSFALARNHCAQSNEC